MTVSTNGFGLCDNTIDSSDERTPEQARLRTRRRCIGLRLEDHCNPWLGRFAFLFGQVPYRDGQRFYAVYLVTQFVSMD
jgi:hypothetical protein